MAMATMLTKRELETRILQVSGDIHWTTIWAESEPDEAAKVPALKAELAALEAKLATGEFEADPVERNANGNEVKRSFVLHESRYVYDFNICSTDKGWQQFDTNQDASYFGVWVNVEKLQVLTYAEGDEIIVKCATVDDLRRELVSMETFYGKAPASFVVFDHDGNRTDLVCERPCA